MVPLFFCIFGFNFLSYIMGILKQTYNPVNQTALRRFLKKFPQYSEIVKTVPEYKKFISIVHNEVKLEMQENPYGVIFPESNYILFINNKGKSKKKAIDFNMTRKLGKVVYHSNIITDQNIMKITFLNKILPSSVVNSDLYYFIPEANLRKKCSEFFRENYRKCLTYGKRR